MNERLLARVSGRVQMVMFRDFVCRSGRSLGLVGSAQNCSDGTVEVIAEGEKSKLEELVKKLHRGSFLSRVKGVEVFIFRQLKV